MSFTSLRDCLGDRLLTEAQRLVALGCVSGTRVLQAGAVVTGIAAGEPQSPAGAARSGPYRVYVRLGAGQLNAECSCKESQPCVHVAAVLVSAEQSAQPPADDRSAGGKP